MNQASIQCTDRNLMRVDHLILRVQTDDMKLFLLGVFGQSRKMALAKFDRIATRRDSSRDLVVRKRGDATAELDACHDLAVSRFLYRLGNLF